MEKQMPHKIKLALSWGLIFNMGVENLKYTYAEITDLWIEIFPSLL